MIIDKKGTTSTVFQENITLAAFIERFKAAYDGLAHDNIIINLFSFDSLTPDDVLEFLELSNQHRAAGQSFVIVTNKVGYDQVPEEINVVPTLEEAKDLIEMEEIERDLGI